MIELIDAQPTLHPEPGRRQFSLQSQGRFYSGNATRRTRLRICAQQPQILQFAVKFNS